ncbi:MAG TPA: HPr(Ser) kinase/phosphatase [Candidatus Eisenbacteria bacterium]|nr:HPr(Ser) kinase/phosphatase [Candidatus Eisenbacteria bacterium]
MNQIPVSRLFEDRKDAFEFVGMTDSLESSVPITVSDINRPGLAMAGYTGNFLSERIQVVGETEVGLLASFTAEEREVALDRLFQFQVPCIIVTKDLDLPASFLARARERQIPVLGTPMSTTPFIHELTAYLDDVFAPTVNCHGSLVDVYGVGLLFTGKSGIGKSEIALDLVERGHRLVADDVVLIKRRHENVLIGSANALLGHHLEIRGVGIIDLHRVFGIRAIRFQKRVEVEVHLQEWVTGIDYERTGLDSTTTTVLGVQIPLVTVPVFPGKNITVIAEVIALNYLVKAYGFDTALELDKKLSEIMMQNSRLKMLARDDLE